MRCVEFLHAEATPDQVTAALPLFLVKLVLPWLELFLLQYFLTTHTTQILGYNSLEV